MNILNLTSKYISWNNGTYAYMYLSMGTLEQITVCFNKNSSHNKIMKVNPKSINSV